MPQQQARLRLRRRFAPWATVGPLLRYLAFWGLIASVIVGGYQWLFFPPGVEALEFTPHALVAPGKAAGVLGVAIGDIDGDGDQDIITAGLRGVIVYQNSGKQKFTATTIESIDAERVQVIDLDKDGALDLLVKLKVSPGVKWYRNDGNISFTGNSIGTGNSTAVWGGDIDGDGDNDIVAATNEGGSIVLRRWMNNGSGQFTSVTLHGESKVTAITIGDINGGYAEIITGGGSNLQFWRTNDGNTWARVDLDDKNQNRTYLAVADINDDGQSDIITADQEKNVVAIYRSIDQQAFDRLVMPGSADAATVVAADLEGDGDQDIIAAAQDDNTIYWYDNDGSESFSQETLATGLQSVFGLAVADLDKDKDLDIATADHGQGIVYWYERVRALPQASAPANIQQSSDGSGQITFETTLSDGDADSTRLRVQYSLDGKTWSKPWLTAVSASAGSVDLKNSNGYQIGTSNAIDTNSNDSVTLTLAWDTKSTQNTGGALVGDVSDVRLRVIPRDAKSIGVPVSSPTFGVDNQAPKGLTGFTIKAVSETQVELGWQPPADSNAVTYTIYYGIDKISVQDETASAWDAGDTAGTIISDLQTSLTYYFKLRASDAYGNSVATPVISGIPTTPTPGSPAPSPIFSSPPDPNVSPTPTALLPTPVASLSPLPSQPLSVPSTTAENQAPAGDAGQNQVVNPSALVILDGTASGDADQDTLTYSWRQVAGPKVNLVSERTATPSFSAGAENESYVFALTVRDSKGATATDTMTVAVRALPQRQAVAVPVGSPPPPVEIAAPVPALVTLALEPANLILFILSLLATGLSLIERLLHSWRDRRSTGSLNLGPAPTDTPRGRVVHYRTGQPIVGAQVLVYGADGKLRASERTGAKGDFSTLFPVGQYTLGVEAAGFAFASSLAAGSKPADGLVYTGGTLNVRDNNQPLTLVIPLKPTATEVGSWRTQVLRSWQAIQHVGRVLSWPIFVLGSLLNTVLVFWVPASKYLIIEISYVALVIVKIVLEVRLRPAYGLVRDAITHVPLDLAVVRLFEAGTNRLIMTRVTNGQGKFFALPPASRYTITVTKPGYAVFSRDNVDITSEHDTALQITTDLMPMAPMGGLATARAAVL